VGARPQISLYMAVCYAHSDHTHETLSGWPEYFNFASYAYVLYSQASSLLTVGHTHQLIGHLWLLE